MTIEIPTLESSMAATEPNPLEQFVHMWSPALSEHSERWRKHLAAAIGYAVQQALLQQQAVHEQPKGSQSHGFSITRAADGSTPPQIMLDAMMDEPDNSV